jgi:hypothetical protein
LERRREGSLCGWLRHVTVNQARGHWRRRRRRPTVGLDPAVGFVDRLEAPDGDLVRKWDRDHDHHEDKGHGNIPKRYVQGPQIRAQTRRLIPVYRGDGFAAIQTRYRWNVAYAPHARAGSVWEQTLIFPEAERFFLSADWVTTVAGSTALSLRVDMLGHIKHRDGMGFDRIYLSYSINPCYVGSIEAPESGPDTPGIPRVMCGKGTGRLQKFFKHCEEASCNRTDVI